MQGHLKRKTDKQVTLIQGVGRQGVGQSMGSVIDPIRGICLSLSLAHVFLVRGAGT